MPEGEQEKAIAEGAREVLETMFFTEVLGPAPAEAVLEDERWVSLEFRGSPPGGLSVGVSAPAARRMAADFLGVEDAKALSEAQVGEVLCELANMIGGSILSRLESETIFDLGRPEAAASAPEEAGAGVVCCRFDLSDGLLAVRLAMRGG